MFFVVWSSFSKHQMQKSDLSRRYASNQIYTVVLHFAPMLFKFMSYFTQRFFDEFREAKHVAK